MPDAVATALGWYSASFNIGAFAGFYWGYVASLTGWRFALAIPGALAIVLGTLIFRSPPVKGASKFNWKAHSFGLASLTFGGVGICRKQLSRHEGPPPQGGCRERRMRIVLRNNGLGVLRQILRLVVRQDSEKTVSSNRGPPLRQG